MRVRPILLITPVLVLCACFCLTELAEVDLHWHLLSGERILDDHRAPRVDTFTYTSSGRPWIDLHWLFQVVVATLHRWAGWDGLDLLKVVMIVGGFGLTLMAALKRSRPGVAAALGLVAVLSAQERFTLRPEAASFLLLGALLLCLEERRARPRRLILVPPLIALWANLHALYAVGLAVIVLVLVGDLFESFYSRRFAGRTRSEASSNRPLLLAAAASFPASLLTPYGFDTWSLPRRLLLERIASQGLYARDIAEFQPPFGGFGFTTSILAFAFLVGIIAVAAIVARGGLRLSDLPLLLAFICLALLARRNVPLFALVSLPAGAAALDAALDRVWRGMSRWRRRDERERFPANVLAALAAVVALVFLVSAASNRFYERDATQRYFGRGPAPGFYPEGAADFVLSHPGEGEVLNDLTMGGYLAWRWFPERRVFIDGRLEVQEPSLYADYLTLQRDPRVFEAVARRYRIDTVLWSHRHSLDAANLLLHLASDGSWRPVFADLSAAVFRRQSTGEAQHAAAPPIDLDAPQLVDEILNQAREATRRSALRDPMPTWLRRIVPRREVPVAEVSAASFFAAVGRHAAAERLLRAALEKAPHNPVLHFDLALVLDRSGRTAAAIDALDLAIRLERGFAPAHAARARLRLRSGNEEGALADWAVAERYGSLSSASLEARGALLARRGQINDAIEDYRKAVRGDPTRASLRADLARLYHRIGLRRQASAEIRRAIELDPEGCAPRVAAARMRALEGEVEEAERDYREIVAAERPCGEAHLGLASILADRGRQDEALREVAAALREGIDPAALSAEPALRILANRPELRELLSRDAEEGK